ncbi:uncharacterized protein A4U43_UnF580 [Asparagus officinalis]|uniref:Uncharacterized protein n=1 Tax=Asparagus officinalis TaxID=4686 RepID=A0A1R3L7R4_ASPOF|nr:uncharacterized protein A4U43_UnF580 [Asparagus officinalis]
MTMASPRKGLAGVMPFASSRTSIVVAVGGLATFLVVASVLLTSYPINSSVQGYFQEGARVDKPSFVSPKENQTEALVLRRKGPPLDGHEGIGIEEPISSNVKEDVDMNEDSVKTSSDKKQIGPSEASDSHDSGRDSASGSKNESQKVSLEIHDKDPATADAVTIVHSPPAELKTEDGKAESNALVYRVVSDRVT